MKINLNDTIKQLSWNENLLLYRVSSHTCIDFCLVHCKYDYVLLPGAKFEGKWHSNLSV